RSTSSRQAGHIRTGARIPRSVISQEASFASRDIFQRVFRHSHSELRSPRRLRSATQRSNASRTSFASRRIRGVYPISPRRFASRTHTAVTLVMLGLARSTSCKGEPHRSLDFDPAHLRHGACTMSRRPAGAKRGGGERRTWTFSWEGRQSHESRGLHSL